MQSRTTVMICFILILLSHTVHYLINYELKLVNDEWEYLIATQALLNGHFTISYPPYEILKEKFGFSAIDSFDAMFLQKNASGNLVPVISIGTILLLAPFLKVFGDHIFYLLPLLFDLIALGSMFLIGKTFLEKIKWTNHTWFAGLLFTVSYAVIVNFRPGLRRDLLCASLIVPLTFLILKGIRAHHHKFWYCAFSIISFLSIIKPTYILLYVPFILSYSASSRLHNSTIHIRNVFIFSLISLVIYSPYLLHNHITTGSFLIPKQIESAKTFIPTGNPLFYLLENMVTIVKAQAVIFSPGNLNRYASIPVVLIIIAGCISYRKDFFVKYWIVPTIALFYLFHIFTRRHDFIYNIYLAPTYSLSIFLFSIGILWILSLIKKRNALLILLCYSLMCIFVFVKCYKTIPGKRHETFQLTDATILKNRVEKQVPPGSLIICDRFLCYTIDYFTHAFSLSPWILTGKDNLIMEKIDYLLEQNVPVYFCTCKGIENAPQYLPLLNERFHLTLVEPFLNENLRLNDNNENNRLSLYRITQTIFNDQN
jgi:hypothetical protein